MTKASCWTHPAFSQVGVCAACLRERLEQLCIEEHCGTPPHRCSFDSNSSVAPPPEENGASGNLASISSMMEADRAEADYHRNGVEVPVEPLPKFASFLQRTHSWSSSRPQRSGFPEARNLDLGKPRTLEKVISGKDLYGNQSLPPSGFLLNEGSCKFDFCETPKGHYKASSWPEIDSRKQQQQQGDQHRMSSWIASLFGIRSKAKDPKDPRVFKSGELKERKKFFRGLGRKKKNSASSVDTNAKLEQEEAFASGEQQQQQHQANGTSRVMPLAGNGDYNFNHKPSLTNMRSVNGRQKPPRDSSWPKAWSTPLRKFMHNKADVDNDSLGDIEEKSSWNASSPAPEVKRFHPSPAFPTNSSYTAYYRDYGSSWSLHSSPMPGSKARWNQQHHRARPWEASRDNFHLHSSSPFHAAGSNTWNFYLTPLRPVRSTTSRHRT
ncbi:uncharacterized protein LOC112349239 [Selaginella moellendorffii]|uniref:uncharacterized protein LOC112349239 n=1 Tax=Selaginella moellendorffii TaxID=88036 RepID=UPI000D1C752E|nr:uncharacterized protein LOC112349239 [Selaginella moellendorffii]|eukprot:XP_024539059.1 uncharacterized protein LOC112349239 [Selaginella moellendorffii]